jgi:hypothetical protein
MSISFFRANRIFYQRGCYACVFFFHYFFPSWIWF